MRRFNEWPCRDSRSKKIESDTVPRQGGKSRVGRRLFGRGEEKTTSRITRGPKITTNNDVTGVPSVTSKPVVVVAVVVEQNSCARSEFLNALARHHHLIFIHGARVHLYFYYEYAITDVRVAGILGGNSRSSSRTMMMTTTTTTFIQYTHTHTYTRRQ